MSGSKTAGMQAHGKRHASDKHLPPPTAAPGTKFVLLAGLSGSGKSVALNMLEDLDYHTIDNLPIAAIDNVVQATLTSGETRYARLAIGIDPRSPPEDFLRLTRQIDAWRARAHGCTVVYLHADEAALIKRYSETRRRHPFSGDDHDLSDAIAAERHALEPLAQLADTRLDTTRTGVHELRELMRERVATESGYPMTLIVESFSYRRGIPEGADLVFDVRCLPNPYWEAALRNQSGRDAEVVAFLEQHEIIADMLAGILSFLNAWIPAYRASNRSYLTVAIGCTGGRHRSVYIAERLARELACTERRILVKHRDLEVNAREAGDETSAKTA